MTSKALKTALATALLTGTDAFWSRGPNPTQAHNERVRKKKEKYTQHAKKEREENITRRNLKKQQKLAQQSLRHIKDMDGKKRTLELAPIAKSFPFPNQLKRGDIVKYKGRAGPFQDEGIQYPSDAVEIIEVIEPAIGPPQYLVANATAPGGEDGPGGPPILVNHADLEAAPLGRSTLGFLKELEELDRGIMEDKYANQALKGAAFPGARVTRDYKRLSEENKDMVMAPTWAETYSANFDRQRKMDDQREKTVAASEKLDKALAIALAERRARPSRLARLPKPGIIESIIPSMYSPAADARASEAMRELATVNAAHNARKEYNDQLRLSRALEAKAMVETGRMMDLFDEAGRTKTGRSLVDARAAADWAATAEVKAAAAAQKLHTTRLNAQQRMSEYTALQNKKYGPRARTRSTQFANKLYKRRNTKKRARAEKNRLDKLKRQRADAKSRMDGDRMDAEEEANEGDDDDDDHIIDEDDVTVDGETPTAALHAKLLEKINDHKYYDGDDNHKFEINGDPPEESLRVKLQTVVEEHPETSDGSGRRRHKSRRHKKKKKSRRPRRHKNRSTRRGKPKKTKRR